MNLAGMLEKLEDRKRLEKRADSHQSGARIVRRFLLGMILTGLEPLWCQFVKPHIS